MKQVSSFIIIVIFCIYHAAHSEPVTTAYVSYKTILCASAGILFAADFGYKKYSKKGLRKIIQEFKVYKVQSDAHFHKSSESALWYSQNLGPQCARKTDTYIQMNQNPIPENIEELAEFLVSYDFRDALREKQGVGGKLGSILSAFESNAGKGLRVFECLIKVQEERITHSLDGQ